MKNVYLCIHAHFYQPNRTDPFTGRYTNERAAYPYANFNAKINAECYYPNAVAGNFDHISFDLRTDLGRLAAAVCPADPGAHTPV